MANYVYQQVVCSKDFLEKYFIDDYPIDKEKRIEPPYISFNKIMGVSDISEYCEKFGECIYYGYGFSYIEQTDGRYLVKFATKREYPIAAIRQAITIDSTIEWYAVEENCIYISKFYWNDGVKEAIAILLDDFFTWVKRHDELDDSLSDEDHITWYYIQDHTISWLPCSEDQTLPRFYHALDE